MNSHNAKRFALLKQAKEHHEHMAKVLGEEMALLGPVIFTDLIADGVKSFRLDGLGVFKDNQDRILTPDVKIHGAIAQQAVFYDILRKSGNGSLIKEVVHPATLDKWIKQQKESNNPLPEESVLKVWTMESAKVRRAPKSATQNQQAVEETATEIETEGVEAHE